MLIFFTQKHSSIKSNCINMVLNGLRTVWCSFDILLCSLHILRPTFFTFCWNMRQAWTTRFRALETCHSCNSKFLQCDIASHRHLTNQVSSQDYFAGKQNNKFGSSYIASKCFDNTNWLWQKGNRMLKSVKFSRSRATTDWNKSNHHWAWASSRIYKVFLPLDYPF